MRFLTPEEVARLTGYKLRRLQCEELKRMRITHIVNARGEPIVLLSAVENRGKPVEQPMVRWEPAVLKGGR